MTVDTFAFIVRCVIAGVLIFVILKHLLNGSKENV